MPKRRVTYLENDGPDVEYVGDPMAVIAVLQSQIRNLTKQLDQRMAAAETATGLALTAAEKTTAIAQATADRAVLKAEAAAGREYLESQIEAVRQVSAQNLIAQKDAMSAALLAAKDALSAAQNASERAIAKAEEASDRQRDQIVEQVRELRTVITEQAARIVPRNEVTARFDAMGEKLTTVENLMRDTVRRAELEPITTGITALQLGASTDRGRSQTSNQIFAGGVAVIGIIIAAGGLFFRGGGDKPPQVSAAQAVAQVQAQADLLSKLDDVVKQLQLNREVQRKAIPSGQQ
jgi:hypothetical protein